MHEITNINQISIGDYIIFDTKENSYFADICEILRDGFRINVNKTINKYNGNVDTYTTFRHYFCSNELLNTYNYNFRLDPEYLVSTITPLSKLINDIYIQEKEKKDAI